MKKVWLRFPLILLALLALTYLGQQFYRDWNHVTVGGVEYPLELEELDLSGQAREGLKVEHLLERFNAISIECGN